MKRVILGVIAALFASALPAFAQFKDETPSSMKLGEEKKQHWRVGVIVSAVGGPVRNIVGYIPVPVEWPEQQIRTAAEEVATEAKIGYETVDDTMRMMVVKIGSLNPGAEAKVLVTLEVTTKAVLPPEVTDGLRVPDKHKLDRKMIPYLAPSPKIESTNARVKSLSRELTGGQEEGWRKAEAIYEWVTSNIEHKPGTLKGAMQAIRDKTGNHEDLSSAFVALCRASDIPARTVWVPQNSYAEFYLQNAANEGRWYPVVLYGEKSFGSTPKPLLILAKGDNFRPPWDKKDHQRYLAENLTGANTPGGAKPRVRFVRELIARPLENIGPLGQPPM